MLVIYGIKFVFHEPSHIWKLKHRCSMGIRYYFYASDKINNFRNMGQYICPIHKIRSNAIFVV